MLSVLFAAAPSTAKIGTLVNNVYERLPVGACISFTSIASKFTGNDASLVAVAVSFVLVFKTPKPFMSSKLKLSLIMYATKIAQAGLISSKALMC